jgi:ATP-dependent RNA helicase DHX37/DHR1
MPPRSKHKIKGAEALQARLEKKLKRAERNYVNKKIAKEMTAHLLERLSHSSFSSDKLLPTSFLGNSVKVHRDVKRDTEEDIISETKGETENELELSVSQDCHLESIKEIPLCRSDSDDYAITSSEEDVQEEPEKIVEHKSTFEANHPYLELYKRPTFYVSISDRNENVQLGRMALPIYQEESNFITMLRSFPILIVIGETGSGKTTQVPQFLYEAGYGHPDNNFPWMRGKICVTQPRRLAAISVSKRVSQELGPTHGHYVGYQVRYDSSGDTASRLIFMTDGILLREISRDVLLSSWSVVILDEAHERNINTDLLIGLLSRICAFREQKFFDEVAAGREPRMGPLKLVIMSATMPTTDFQQERVFKKSLFPSLAFLDSATLQLALGKDDHASLESMPFPPVLHVPGRQHSVTVHFSRRTPEDYVAEACRKIMQIHSRLPQPGNILVFVSGRQEVWRLMKLLSEAQHRNQQQIDAVEDENDIEDISDWLDVEDVHDKEKLEENRSDSESDNVISTAPMRILPLYSLLAENEQTKVFQAGDPNERVCIIATNIAETSLTLPGIKYVVDCGKVKSLKAENFLGKHFQTTWISKASAAQRAGRAGRLGPGHCYRLYSSAMFQDVFEPFSTPEIATVPLVELVLRMKAFHIDNIASFPFITSPDARALKDAEGQLYLLGALEPAKNSEILCISPLGSQLADIPIRPSLAKMLLTALSLPQIPANKDYLCLSIYLTATLSVGELFLHQDKDLPEYMKSQSNVPSDLSRFIQVYFAYFNQPEQLRKQWANQVGLRAKALEESRLLAKHLHRCLTSIFPNRQIPPLLDNIILTAESEEFLMVLFLSAHPHHIARLDEEKTQLNAHKKGKSSFHHIYRTLGLHEGKLSDMLQPTGTFASISRSSVLHYIKPRYKASYSPLFIVYVESLVLDQPNVQGSGSKQHCILQNCFLMRHDWFFDHLKPYLSFRKSNQIFFGEWQIK